MLTLGYIKETYPHSFDAIIAISDENIESLSDSKELEDDFINDQTFSEIEKIMTGLFNFSEQDMKEKLNIKLTLKDEQILENENSMIEVIFSKDEYINKLIKLYPIIEEFYDTIQGLNLLDDYFI